MWDKTRANTKRTRFLEVTDQLGLLLRLGRLGLDKQFGAREFSLLLQLGFVEPEFLFVFREDGGVGSFQTGVEVVLCVPSNQRLSTWSKTRDEAHCTIIENARGEARRCTAAGRPRR